MSCSRLALSFGSCLLLSFPGLVHTVRHRAGRMARLGGCGLGVSLSLACCQGLHQVEGIQVDLGRGAEDTHG